MPNVAKDKNIQLNTDEELQNYFETHDPVNESYKRLFG
jgi:hypothetical protein